MFNDVLQFYFIFSISLFLHFLNRYFFKMGEVCRMKIMREAEVVTLMFISDCILQDS